MANHTAVWTFLRAKPKPPKAAVSPGVRKAIDDAFNGHTEPSEKLRDDYRRYTEFKNKRAA